MVSTATWDFNTALAAAIAGSDISAAGDATNVNCAIFSRTNPSSAYPTNVLQTAPQASTLTEAASITNGVYYTVSVTGTGTISRFQIKAAKGGSGTRGIAVRSSADSYANNIISSGSIATTRPTLTSYDSGAISIALSGTVTFRIYVYAPTAASTIEMDDIVITVDPPAGTALSIPDFSVGSPTFGTATLAQVHAVSISNFAVGSPSLGPPTLGQKHTLTIPAFAVSSPSLGPPTIGQKHALSIGNFSTSSPTLGPPSLGGGTVNGFTISSFTVGSPTFGAIGFQQKHGLAIGAVNTASPTFGAVSLGTKHVLAIPAFATGSPDIGVPSVSTATLGGPLLASNVLSATNEDRTHDASLEVRYETAAVEMRVLS